MVQEEDPRVVTAAQAAVDGPAERVLEDRYTDFDNAGGGGGGSSAPAIPSPYPARVDPGFYSAPKDHPLRKALAAVSKQKAYSHMRLAIADLTDDPKRPVYVGYDDTKQTFIASTAKLAILQPAFMLRKAARDAVAAITAKDDKEFFRKLAKAWASEFRRFNSGVKDANNSAPVLPRILTARRAKNTDPFTIDFNAQATGNVATAGFLARMTQSLKSSSNENSASCIRDLGFPYIHGVAKEAGFYVKNGLWVSRDFGGRDWFPGFKGSVQAGTARSIAELLALLAQDRLVEPGLASEIRLIMAGEGQYASSDLDHGIWDRLTDAERRTYSHQSKVGYADGVFGDCGIIRRKSAKGASLVYIAVGFGGKSHDEIKQVAAELDDCVLLAHGEPVKPAQP